jgi:peroxiredoxin
MLKLLLTITARSSLLLLVGCGDAPTNEPQKLDAIVAEEPAEPLTHAEPVAETPKPVVEQAAFAEPADAASTESAEPVTVPPVVLTNDHEALCRVKVGDTLPEIELPQVDGGSAKLSGLYGKAATVVVFWKGDRQMAIDELADLGPDVVEKFGSRGVEVVGVAVADPAEAGATIKQSAASFPQLLDEDGKAFDKVGSTKLPWTLVVDANGKIVWFDLEYSLATRRELQQALLATIR